VRGARGKWTFLSRIRPPADTRRFGGRQLPATPNAAAAAWNAMLGWTVGSDDDKPFHFRAAGK